MQHVNFSVLRPGNLVLLNRLRRLVLPSILPGYRDSCIDIDQINIAYCPERCQVVFFRTY